MKHLSERVLAAFNGQPSLEQVQGIVQEIRTRLAKIDEELKKLKEPVNPGTGGREYLRVLREGTPEELQKLADRREVLEAERRQLTLKAKEMKAVREKAEIRAAREVPKQLEKAVDEIEQAYAAYQQAIKHAEHMTRKLQRVRQFADRHQVAGPSLKLEIADRLYLHMESGKGSRRSFVRGLSDDVDKAKVLSRPAIELQPSTGY